MRGDDTIFALSSGAPPAAIAIVRISGQGAAGALIRLGGALPPPRQASLRRLRDPGDGTLLDRALVLWFPGDISATGEDLAELHLHGGRAVVAAVGGALAALKGLRPAEPGEFTRRAFSNGRIDLAEAEGLADLLAAETEAQRRTALAAAEGGLSRRVERWRVMLLAVSAQVEALIDFDDEGDIAASVAAVEAKIRDGLTTLAGEIAADLASPPAERLRDGLRVVIAGPPNAGKSTLFNALTGREAAITAPRAGTTRDLIEAPVAIDGLPFVFVDSAGLRAARGMVEQAGIARARSALTTADIVLWLGAPNDRPAGALLIHAKADLKRRRTVPNDAIAVSARDGSGIAALRHEFLRRARELVPAANAVALNDRQRMELGVCEAALKESLIHSDPLLVAEHLNDARGAMDRLTGRSSVEEMLDALFARFCLGK